MRRKGFTLVELLAVIVILAIISLISFPIIKNVIDKAKKGAAEDSAYSYISSFEVEVAKRLINNELDLKINDSYYLYTDTEIDGKTYSGLNNIVEIKGTMPEGTEDYLYIGNGYKVIEGSLTFDGYVIIYKDGKVTDSYKEANEIKIENMELNLSDTILEKNDSLRLTVAFKPSTTSNKFIEYKTSNKNVAEIDNYGNIKAVGSGSATITAISKSNRNIKKTIEIRVIDSGVSFTVSSKKITYETNIAINFNDNVTKKYKIGNNNYNNYIDELLITSNYIIDNNLSNGDGTFTVCAKGINLKNEENEKCKTIDILDLDRPILPVITPPKNVPTATSEGIKMLGLTTIVFDTRTDIKNYYSIDDKNTWIEYSSPFTSTSKIYAKSVKNNSGLSVISEASPVTSSDYVPEVAYDGDVSTYIQYKRTNNCKASSSVIRYLNVDPSAWGKNISLSYVATDNTSGEGYAYMYFLDSSSASLGYYQGRSNSLLTISKVIPENTTKIKLYYYNTSLACDYYFRIYELKIN